MNKRPIVRNFLLSWLKVVLLLAGIGGYGCTKLEKFPVPATEVQLQAPQTGSEERARSEAAVSSVWEEGMSTFRAGDYKTALDLFEVVSTSSKSDALRHRALYAMACTRLALAQGPDQFSAAMNLWELWSNSAPAEALAEDPRMLSPLLERWRPSMQHVKPDASEMPAGNCPRPTSVQSVRLIKDKDCEKLLQSKEKETQRLRRQIEALRHQIEALEAIHRKIQEKKQEVSSP
jgi:hypothetical protein